VREEEKKHLESTIVLQAGGKHLRIGNKRFVEVDLFDFSVDFYSMEDVCSSPQYDLKDFGFTRQVVGLET
jgi:hypothetical protein